MKLILNNTTYNVANEREALHLVLDYCDENTCHYTKTKEENLPEGVKVEYNFFEISVNEYGDAQRDYFASAQLKNE